MTFLQAFVLGVIQGATEFLPISSSGHLVLVPWLAGWRLDPRAALVFDVLVHWGTLLAVVIYFWPDLVTMASAWFDGLKQRRPFEDPAARLAWLVLVGSVPAAIAGITLEDLVSETITTPSAVSALLLVTAALLALSEVLGRRVRELSDMSLPHSLWIGIAQALALFPGISRSGATIATGMFTGLKRDQAARFSFLMAIPVIFGAGIIALVKLLSTPGATQQIGPVAVGFLAALVVGYLAIRGLLAFLARWRMTVFVIYCALVGSIGLLLSVTRG